VGKVAAVITKHLTAPGRLGLLLAVACGLACAGRARGQAFPIFWVFQPFPPDAIRSAGVCGSLDGVGFTCAFDGPRAVPGASGPGIVTIGIADDSAQTGASLTSVVMADAAGEVCRPSIGGVTNVTLLCPEPLHSPERLWPTGWITFAATPVTISQAYNQSGAPFPYRVGLEPPDHTELARAQGGPIAVPAGWNLLAGPAGWNVLPDPPLGPFYALRPDASGFTPSPPHAGAATSPASPIPDPSTLPPCPDPGPSDGSMPPHPLQAGDKVCDYRQAGMSAIGASSGASVTFGPSPTWSGAGSSARASDAGSGKGPVGIPSPYVTVPPGVPLPIGTAVWAHFDAPAQLWLTSVNGAPYLSWPISAGQWTTIGNPSTDVASVWGADAVYAWDPVAGAYTETDTLQPLQGAWAWSTAGGSVTVSSWMRAPSDAPSAGP
jgi:hypothetical protein